MLQTPTFDVLEKADAHTEEPGRAGGGRVVVVRRLLDGLRQRERVSHHRPVQTILSHDRALPPRLFCLAPLRATVLEPNLKTNEEGMCLSSAVRNARDSCELNLFLKRVWSFSTKILAVIALNLFCFRCVLKKTQ